MSETLGDLSANELGRIIRFRDGGATFEGVLTIVQHNHGLRGQEQSMVGLELGQWRHIKTYPADTSCDVLCGDANEDRLCRRYVDHFNEWHDDGGASWPTDAALSSPDSAATSEEGQA